MYVVSYSGCDQMGKRIVGMYTTFISRNTHSTYSLTQSRRVEDSSLKVDKVV